MIFYIDLLSIARGLYNKNTLLFEVDTYINSRKMPDFLINELKDFLNTLYKNFKKYCPRFIIFFDKGECKQNCGLLKSYKKGRSHNDIILQDDERDLLKQIRQYYLSEIEKQFNKPNLSNVFNLNEYETDFIPYYIINNNLINSQNNKNLNVILSLDKDLLQCCQFDNTIQYITLFAQGELTFNIYHNDTAISYFYKQFKRGLLGAKYIPMLLALSGDKSDNVDGLKNVGYAKAYKLIIQHKLDHEISIVSPLPKELEQYRKQIYTNYQIISFESQISRIPQLVLSRIKEAF